MRYFKELDDNSKIISPSLFFVEYNVGMQLCSYFKVPVNNRTPHSDSPSYIYNYIFHMIKWFRISLDELLKGSVNQIYKRIIMDKNKQSMNEKINF